MVELREEIDVYMSSMGRMKKIRLKWTGHMERMEEERMAKRADRSREEDKRLTVVEMGGLYEE